MPLLRYFGSVGTALLTLLLVSHWLLAEPTTGPVRTNIDKTFIRISSIEKLPEKVVFDTSLPYVTPPPSVASPRTVASAAAPPVRTPPVQVPPVRSAFAFVQITPGPLPGFTKASYVFLNAPGAAKRDVAALAHDRASAPKKVAGHRTPPAANAPAARAQAARAPEPVTRLSLIDVIKDRFSRGLF